MYCEKEYIHAIKQSIKSEKLYNNTKNVVRFVKSLSIVTVYESFL